MDWLPLNLALMSTPSNWVIITLMMMIAGLGLGLIFHPENGED